jgi:hypothetical protein
MSGLSKRQTDALAHFVGRMATARGTLKLHFEAVQHQMRDPGAVGPDMLMALHAELTRFMGLITADLRALAEALGDGAVAVPVAPPPEGVTVLGVDPAAQNEDRTVYHEVSHG